MERFHLGFGGMISYLCLPPLLSVPVSYFLPSCMVRCYLIFDDMFRSCFLIFSTKQLGNSREQEKWKESLTRTVEKCLLSLFHDASSLLVGLKLYFHRNKQFIYMHNRFPESSRIIYEIAARRWRRCRRWRRPRPLSSSPGKHRAILSWVFPVIKRLQMLRCWKSHFPGGGFLGGFPISRWFPQNFLDCFRKIFLTSKL